MLNRKQLECDLCVIGGGMSGMAAAIAAAREGAKVVLMHERPVLGGNASSEIRMWICGAQGRDNRETGILEEIALENLYRNPTKNYAVGDTVLYDFIKREKNIQLLLNCTCMDAETEKGEFAYGRNRRINTVTGYQMTTQTFYDVKAKYFCDSSGDSILAPLCDAEFRMGREAGKEFGEDTNLEEADKMTMGMSCLLQGRETTKDIKFTAPEWSTKLTSEHFAKRKIDLSSEYLNYWWLELGGNRNTIDDTEELRDELVALAVGTWDHIKNSGEYDSDKWELDFLSFLPGKRESRRMMGEYIITERDISGGRVFEDEVAFGGWPIDDHYPGGFYHRGKPNTNIQPPSPYSLPYRALYSKNVENLFFAGRNISMTHMAMSSIRVMATCLLLGEAVGKAASIAARKGYTPHDVYLNDVEELQRLLMEEDCFLPSKLRNVSDVCKKASLNVDGENLRNGQDRAHRIYGTDENTASYYAPLGKEIAYSFDKSEVKSVHIVFDSDLNRTTLPGGGCERGHSMRANVQLDSPQFYMPKTLCKEFTVAGELNGVRTELLRVENNRKRAHHIEINGFYDKLVLIPSASWGDGESVAVISFDFE